MAVPPDLNPRERRRLLAVVALVLLLHVVALEGLLRWTAETRLLKPFVAPMYTRLLEPQAPAAPPPVVAQAAPAPPPPTRMRATPSVPAQSTRTLPQIKETAPPPEPPPAVAETPAPEPAPPEPEPETPVAQAPEPAPDTTTAPAPTPGASAPGAGTDTAAVTPGVDGWPSDTRLSYRLGGRFRSGELYGDARVLWQRVDKRYQVRVEVTLTFLASLIMTSQGEVDPVTLRPQVYEEVRNGRPRGLRLNETEVLLANGKVLPRPPGVQDTASQFVELSHRFASGQEKLEVGRAVSFWMARPGAMDLWTYDVVEREVLKTALGEVEAFHLKPRPIANPRGNITAEMWFAPSLQYLPVRIRVNMGEEAHVDLVVESIEQR
jgi:hypothetical protein